MIDEINESDPARTDQDDSVGHLGMPAAHRETEEKITMLASDNKGDDSPRQNPHPSEKRKLTLIIILIAVLLGLALLYVNGVFDRFSGIKIGGSSSDTRDANEDSTQQSVNRTEEISDIEKDLQGTDVENLDGEINTIKQELK